MSNKEYMKRYRKTKKGLLVSIYTDQIQSSRERNHPAPVYSREDFYDWMMSQEKFHHFYHLWVNSSYDSLLKPSVDRIDDFLPYSFSNIQLMTWGENRRKQFDDIVNGTGTSGKYHCKAVMQYSVDGELLAKFHSASSAARSTGVNHSKISEVCRGKRRIAGGFIWRYGDVPDDNVFLEETKHFRRVVVQYSKDNKKIATYGSASEAEKATGVNHSKIAAVCRGKRKTSGGFIWKYKNEEGK